MEARTGSWNVAMMLAIMAMFVLLVGCSKKQEQGASPSAGATPGQEGSISGTITVSPELKDKIGQAPLLMITASTSSDQTRPALVVKREADVKFPYQYKLTSEDITLVGSSFTGNMYVTAKIDPAGTVGPPRPGTFGGTYAHNPVPVGSSKIDIVIDKTY